METREVRVPLCDWCDEPVLPGERANVKGGNLHGNCAVRTIVGSLGHQMHVCSCCLCPDFAVEDPPGVSKRMAADMAAAYWRNKNANKKKEQKNFASVIEALQEKAADHCTGHLQPPGR